MFGAQQQNPPSRDEMIEFIIKELDEIKRYAAGTYSKVDGEIDEIRNMVNKLENTVVQMERHLERMDQQERLLGEINHSVKELQRRVK